MIRSALEVCTYRVSLRQISKVLVYATNLTSSNSVAIIIICINSARPSNCRQRYCKRVFNEAAKRMIRSNSAEDGHKTVPENWQIRTIKNSALAWFIWTRNRQFLKSWSIGLLLDNLDYVMALECELLYWAHGKSHGWHHSQKFQSSWKTPNWQCFYCSPESSPNCVL